MFAYTIDDRLTHINPSIPFEKQTFLFPGKCFVLALHIQSGDQRAINFRGEKDDIIFHFNPRIKDNVVVRNSYIGGNWGNEERDLCFANPFVPNASFEIIIQVDNQHFNFYLQNNLLLKYQHRAPYQAVRKIEITGSVEVKKFSESGHVIMVKHGLTPQHQHPHAIAGSQQGDMMCWSVPHDGSGLRHGSTVSILGMIAPGAEKFKLILKSTDTNDIGLELDAKLGKDKPAKLSDRYNDDVGNEQKSNLYFRAGELFCLQIVFGPDGFYIIKDIGQDSVHFVSRGNGASQRWNKLEIKGPVEIRSVYA